MAYNDKFYVKIFNFVQDLDGRLEDISYLDLIDADSYLVNLGLDKGILDTIIQSKLNEEPIDKQHECMFNVLEFIVRKANWI